MTHGQMLSGIAKEIRRYMTNYPLATYVREKALETVVGPKAKSIPTLYKVVGVSDLYACSLGSREFIEMNPKTVKCLVANDANAEKIVVAKSLEQFVGPQEYACDDESDAVAVGVAWLIENGYIESPYKKGK